MNKVFLVILSVAMAMLSGCASNKNQPVLVKKNQKWIQINPDDFVPPKAKAFIKVTEVDLENMPEADEEKQPELESD